jgi:hypothetical protein
MQSSIKNVVLVGAGGNAGPAILAELMKSPFKVSVLSRADSSSIFPPGVKVIKSDYSYGSLVAALKVSLRFLAETSERRTDIFYTGIQCRYLPRRWSEHG